MSKKKHAYKTKKQKLVREDELAPGIAAGLTQGLPAEEALRAHPVTGRPGVETIRHMTEDKKVHGMRVPVPHFVGKNASTGFVRESMGRKMGDVQMQFTPEVMRAMREGSLCLRCLEPQSYPFEDSHLPGCEGVLLHGPRYMKDRQILDIAMEFEGEVHVGPSKPMQEMLDAQDERMEKRRFIDRVLQGGQGRIPKAWLTDATLLESLTTEEIKALRRLI